MYVETAVAAKTFATGLKKTLKTVSDVEVLLAPSFTFLPFMATALKGVVRVGAQTLAPSVSNASTGGVSAAMLLDAGASFVIIGHSERRALGETEDMIRAQLESAFQAGLTPILCIGELERDPAGGHFAVVAAQLRAALQGTHKTRASKIIIAYEPVWAIGKDAAHAMQAADVQEMVIFIRKNLADIMERAVALKIPILYGGSVEAENARTLITEGGVSGFLVGRASSSVGSFSEIIKACR